MKWEKALDPTVALRGHLESPGTMPVSTIHFLLFLGPIPLFPPSLFSFNLELTSCQFFKILEVASFLKPSPIPFCWIDSL